MRWYDVAVICYNEQFTIRRCLTAIQAYANYERLIVVDDLSTDGTREVAEKFADEMLVSGHRNLGISRNLALGSTMAPVLLFVDADVEIVRDVDPIVKSVTRTYPCVRGKNWQLMSNRFTRAHEWGVGFGLTAIDTMIAKKVGGFPEVEAGEDSAFCIELSKAGYKTRQVEDRVYGLHYKSDYATLPPRREWPCENFDRIVEAIGDVNIDEMMHHLGQVDDHKLRSVVSLGLAYGVNHQLRKRRGIIID